MTNNVNAEVREFIMKKFPLTRNKQIKDSDPLLKGGYLDSLGILTVVEFIEKEFAVHIEDEELISNNFESIDEIAAFIRKKTNGAEARP